ncbi:MAG: hypothetical protein K9M82_06330 [Deltaproteobacteria bacterium]|nr:hypothetical protein [Deltaproteobacteria bacterium]
MTGSGKRVLACLVVMAIMWILAAQARAQDEAASHLLRYRDREASTGYYEEYEVMPRHLRAFIEPRPGPADVVGYSPNAPTIRDRTRLADSHYGIRFYDRRRCETCHPEEARNLHTTRANLTCRQCHGGEPIPGSRYYYAPMNPIRRHAYICAKCHQGANASFATYRVHEPNPALLSTQATFPVLFWVFWIMIVIAAGTFLLFLPHTALWGIRELLAGKKGTHREREDQ